MKLAVLTIRDKKHIIELFRDVFSNPPWNDDWSDEEQLDAYISDLIGQNNSLTLSYMDGDRIAALSMGHVKHWFTGTEYCIDELCVDRRMQEQGIGSAFLRAMEAYLSEDKISRIFLQTNRNVPAYAFYARRGFLELPDHVSFAKKVNGQIT